MQSPLAQEVAFWSKISRFVHKTLIQRVFIKDCVNYSRAYICNSPYARLTKSVARW
ncbi:MAG: hypothetical protein ACRY3E_00945 [Candidatus Lariskella arthropodorum]